MLQKKIRFILLAILILNLFILIKSVNATTQSISDGMYEIETKVDSNKVLEVIDASNVSGANVQIFTRNNAKCQKVNVKYMGDGYYTISFAHSGKYLDVANGKKADHTNVWQCNRNTTDAQKWIIKDAGNGYYNIISKCSNTYLTVAGGKTSNCTNIEICTGDGNNNSQKFKFKSIQTNTEVIQGTKTISDGMYQIEIKADSSKVLEVIDASNVSGANVQIFTRNNAKCQKVNVKYMGDGYYTISFAHSGKYLDVANGKKADHTNVWQCNRNTTDAQKWIIKDAGNGYYNIISKCSNTYLTVAGGKTSNCTNIEICTGDGNNNSQKFKFKSIQTNTEVIQGTKTISDGMYQIITALDASKVINVANSSKISGGNVQISTKNNENNQKVNIKYIENGYYTISFVHSGMYLDVADGKKDDNTNVWQCNGNSSDAQKWIIKDVGNGYYNIISKCSNTYLTVSNSNIVINSGKGTENAQKFKFETTTKTNSTTPTPQTITLDSAKYPLYKEKIEALVKAHPNWNFKFLYTGIKFSDAVAGEYSVRKRNLVPTSYGGEWISGTTLYDTGWYGASEKAIAYYMDPRNFLDDINVFQFQDVNEYIEGACTIEGIRSKVSGTFLSGYENDINGACLNTNVNPYYIIARLIQEQGTKGGSTVKMKDGDKYYYNPFNIGASGDSTSQVIANALAYAKKEGWDTMQKALEGGIHFCKVNWLDNYQNTLYQNKFDIDSTNGTSLYSHQYMQNLLGAYSEARTLYSMYKNTNTVDSKFTFIIPLYENMDKTVSSMPSNTTESYPINVKTTGTNINLRSDANTNSSVIKVIETKGTVLLSVQRGINSSWNKIVLPDGTIGYMSSTYLAQIDDVKTCNYGAKVKTNDGDGCKIRVGPGLKLDMINVLSDGTQVTVIDDTTYKGIDGYDWYRVMLSNGIQGFMPGQYLAKVN